MSTNNPQRFVIYSGKGEVLGFVEHVNGDRAVDKVEDTIGQNDLLWDSWTNATKGAKQTARRLGAIT